MRQHHYSYFFLGSFLSLTFALQWFQSTNYTHGPLTLGVFAGYAFIVSSSSQRLQTSLRIGSAISLGFLCAFLSVQRTTHIPTLRTIDSYANKQYVEIQGVVSAEPDRRPMQIKYTIDAKQIRTTEGTIVYPVQGKVLITDRRMWPEYRYGESVSAKGVLQKPEAIEDFQYDRYLSRYGIYAVMYQAGLRYASTEYGGMHPIKKRVFGTLFLAKQRFEDQINTLYPEPHASFMAGLLTGSRKGIPEHLMQKFNTTGLTHIIAISGYNITIVIVVITGALFFLPFRWRFLPAVVAIAAFTLFVGASAAVVRASIMGILGLLALQLGRLSSVRLSVLWTLFFMLVWNPKYLWYDAGFQLSFLAVLGLIEVAPLIERWFSNIPKTLGTREALQMTCSAQISAVPLIIFLFGRVSLIAPIANVLVAPFIPLAMLFGFMATCISFLFPTIGLLFAYIGWLCLEWIIGVASFLSAIPYASLNLAFFDIRMIVGYYVLLSVVVVSMNRKHA